MERGTKKTVILAGGIGLIFGVVLGLIGVTPLIVQLNTEISQAKRAAAHPPARVYKTPAPKSEKVFKIEGFACDGCTH